MAISRETILQQQSTCASIFPRLLSWSSSLSIQLLRPTCFRRTQITITIHRPLELGSIGVRKHWKIHTPKQFVCQYTEKLHTGSRGFDLLAVNNITTLIFCRVLRPSRWVIVIEVRRGLEVDSITTHDDDSSIFHVQLFQQRLAEQCNAIIA